MADTVRIFFHSMCDSDYQYDKMNDSIRIYDFLFSIKFGAPGTRFEIRLHFFCYKYASVHLIMEEFTGVVIFDKKNPKISVLTHARKKKNNEDHE